MNYVVANIKISSFLNLLYEMDSLSTIISYMIRMLASHRIKNVPHTPSRLKRIFEDCISILWIQQVRMYSKIKVSGNTLH